MANQNTENRSKASGSCNENCSNVKNGSSWMIQSCSPPDSDGSTQDSLCSWTGRVEACGGVSNYYCCPSSGAQWTQSMTTECNASLAKLTPTSVVPTIVPTMPVTGSKMVKFVFSYAGIKPDVKCVNNWPISVVVLASDGTTKTFSNVISTKLDGSTSTGLAKYKASVVLDNFNYTSGLSVFIKGSKHLQVKYGMDGQTAFYSQQKGTLGVSSGDDPNPNWLGYDFTGYPLLAGDVNQDGVVDGVDFSQVKTAAITRRAVSDGDNMVEDLNGNCAMESQDVGLLMITLNQKQDQLY